MKRIQIKQKRRFTMFSILMLIVFLFYNIILVVVIRDHYYEIKKMEAMRLNETYAAMVAKVSSANEIVDELLDQQILVSLGVITRYGGTFDNEVLAELANLLELDEIYVMDDQTEIIYSATLRYIGWRATPGHPVYEFWHGELDIYSEDIRKDSESDEYFKYGYARISEESFVQIGIAAERIYDLASAIQVINLLDEIKEVYEVVDVYFITAQEQIITSSNTTTNITFPDAFVMDRISDNVQYGHIMRVEGRTLYETFINVSNDDTNQGVLALRYSMHQTHAIILLVFMIAAIPSAIVYLILVYLITLKMKSDDNLLRLAYQDPVTGLNNRTYLKEVLKDESFEKSEHTGSLILINCSNFKFINQSFGFEAGDAILREIGKRLLDVKLDGDVYRFTADRFVVYFEHEKSNEVLMNKVKIINDLFGDPFLINGTYQHLLIQMGVVTIDDRYMSLDQLLKDASFAVSQLDKTSMQNFMFFDESMDQAINRENKILQHLKQELLDSGLRSLRCQFQPIVHLQDHSIVSFEALARLHMDELGNISPIEFIDIAERNQLIVPLGLHILQDACRFISMMQDNGHDGIRISINISAIELLRENFVKDLFDTLLRNNIDPSLITLEITESIILSDFKLVNRKLKQLQAYRIKIALDDFGVGYSSFSRLDMLNIDVLKIDKSFVDKINSNDQKDSIVQDIISMAHKVGLQVIAEGVDHPDQLEYLMDHQCDMIQGYLFSQPLEDEDALRLLANWRNRP